MSEMEARLKCLELAQRSATSNVERTLDIASKFYEFVANSDKPEHELAEKPVRRSRKTAGKTAQSENGNLV